MCWGLPNFYRFHIGKHSLGCLLMLGVRRGGFGIHEPKPGVIFFVAPMRSYSRSEHFGSILPVETSFRKNHDKFRKASSTMKDPTFPSFLGVMSHMLGVYNLYFSWFWGGPRAVSVFHN